MLSIGIALQDVGVALFCRIGHGVLYGAPFAVVGIQPQQGDAVGCACSCRGGGIFRAAAIICHNDGEPMAHHVR